MLSFDQMVKKASNYVNAFKESQKAFFDGIEQDQISFNNSLNTDTENYSKVNVKFHNSEFLNSFDKALENDSIGFENFDLNKSDDFEKRITQSNLKFHNPEFLDSFEKTLNY